MPRAGKGAVCRAAKRLKGGSAVAAVISYRHAVLVVTSHGEPGMVGHLYPVVIDGLIVAASMVLLDSARHSEKPPVLSVWLLGAGIGATLAANVLAGVPSGLLGAIVAAWPAAGFVGCYELLMMLVRASARRTGDAATDPPQPTPGAVPSPVPTSAQNAAVIALKATLAACNPLSGRQLETRFGLSRAEATKVRQSALADANSKHPEDPGEAAPDN